METNDLNIFPEDDPTVAREKVSVEETLGMMRYVKRSTKNRSQWRFLTGDDITVSKIREFYGLDHAAVIMHRGNEWAVWAGEGQPDSKPFEPESEVLPQDDVRPRSYAIEAGVVELAAAGVPPAVLEALVQTGRTSSSAPNPGKPPRREIPQAWAYSSKVPFNADEMRKRFETRSDAPIVLDGVMAAIWLGDGPPTRPAFRQMYEARQSAAGGAASTNGLVERGASKSATIPENALNGVAMKLFEMSRDEAFEEGLRRELVKISDVLHAWAGRCEVMRLRARLESRR